MPPRDDVDVERHRRREESRETRASPAAASVSRQPSHAHRTARRRGTRGLDVRPYYRPRVRVGPRRRPDTRTGRVTSRDTRHHWPGHTTAHAVARRRRRHAREHLTPHGTGLGATAEQTGLKELSQSSDPVGARTPAGHARRASQRPSREAGREQNSTLGERRARE